jgi:hypothetical protein
MFGGFGIPKPGQAGQAASTAAGVGVEYAQAAGGNVGTEAVGKLAEGFNALREGGIAPLTFAFKELATAPMTVKRWSEELLASQKHLQAFNASIARTFGEAERREILRNVRSGARTSASTERLSEALQDLQDKTEEMKDGTTNALNNILASLTKLTTIGFLLVRESSKMGVGAGVAIKWLEKLNEKAAPEESRFESFMSSIRSGEHMRPPYTKTPGKTSVSKASSAATKRLRP